MTSDQIHSFLNVAKYLNFTEAASPLYKSKSSLIRDIANLETELGLTLFVRTKNMCNLLPVVLFYIRSSPVL